MNTRELHLQYSALTQQGSQTLTQIIALYDLISESLSEFSKLSSQDATLALEQEYETLCETQDNLISLALALNLTGVEDCLTLLGFWRKISIEERTEEDMLYTDHLVIAVHDYLQAA